MPQTMGGRVPFMLLDRTDMAICAVRCECAPIPKCTADRTPGAWDSALHSLHFGSPCAPPTSRARLRYRFRFVRRSLAWRSLQSENCGMHGLQAPGLRCDELARSHALCTSFLCMPHVARTELCRFALTCLPTLRRGMGEYRAPNAYLVRMDG